jgi:hypothetical protein
VEKKPFEIYSANNIYKKNKLTDFRVTYFPERKELEKIQCKTFKGTGDRPNTKVMLQW